MPDPLDAIRERLAKATPGPWCWGYIGEKTNGYIIGTACDEDGKPFEGNVPEFYANGGEVILHSPSMIGEHEASTVRYGDASLIAHAPTDLAYLLARLAAAEKVVEAAERALHYLALDLGDPRTQEQVLANLAHKAVVEWALSDPLDAYHATRKGTP